MNAFGRRHPRLSHRHRNLDTGLAREGGSLLDLGQRDYHSRRRVLVVGGFFLAPKHDHVRRGYGGTFRCLSEADRPRVSGRTLVEACDERSSFGIVVRGVLEVLPPQNRLPGDTSREEGFLRPGLVAGAVPTSFRYRNTVRMPPIRLTGLAPSSARRGRGRSCGALPPRRARNRAPRRCAWRRRARCWSRA
jgi:hypothetical protein